MAHSRSFLANQKARNAIVGAENLLSHYSSPLRQNNKKPHLSPGSSSFIHFITREPTTSPASDALEMMLCSCANLFPQFPLDIDECKEGKDGCDKATTTCTNYPGNYRCDCKHGYRAKDRHSCQRKWKRI